jgi:hypothetical protein
LEPDSVNDRSSGVSVPVDPRLDRDTRDADDAVDDDSSVLRSPLLRPCGRDDGDGPSSSAPATPAVAPPTQQNIDFHDCAEAITPLQDRLDWEMQESES